MSVRAGQVAGAIAGWVALLVAATWPALRAPWTHVPGVSRGDLWNALWGVGFLRDALSQGHLPWRTDRLAAPEGGVLWLADPLGTLAAAGAELALPGAAAWSLVSVLRLVGAAAAMDAFVRAWLHARAPDAPEHHRLAGWAAGATWMLASPLTMCLRNGTSEGTDGIGLVLAVHLAWRAARGTGVGSLAAAAGGTALACASQPYGALVAGMAAGAVVLTEQAPVVRRVQVLALVALAGGAYATGLSALLAHPEQLARGAVVATNHGPPAGADLAGWWSHTCAARPRPGPDGELAHCHAMAFPLLLLAGLGALRARRDATRWAALALAAALLASGHAWTWAGHRLAAGVPTPWSLLPDALTDALAQPWRLSLGVWFAAAVLIAHATRGPGRWRAHAVVVVIVWSALQTPATHRPIPLDTRPAPALIALAQAPHGAAIAYPVSSARRALWDQRTHGKPLLQTLNDGRTPRANELLALLATFPSTPADLRPAAADAARAAGVRYLVVRSDAQARTDPARAVVDALLTALPPVGDDGEGVRVRAFW